MYRTFMQWILNSVTLGTFLNWTDFKNKKKNQKNILCNLKNYSRWTWLTNSLMLIFPMRLVWYRFGHQITSISRVTRPSLYPIIRLLMHIILAIGIDPWAFLLAARRACTRSVSPCFSCSVTSTCPFHNALSFKVTMFCLAKACLIMPR